MAGASKFCHLLYMIVKVTFVSKIMKRGKTIDFVICILKVSVILRYMYM